MNNSTKQVIILSGTSRSGKTLGSYLLNCIENVDICHNLVMFDWAKQLNESKSINSLVYSRLLDVMVEIYSWYSYLGRQLNLRSVDNSSFQRLLPEDDFSIRESINDNDEEWVKFHEKWKNRRFIPCFTADLSIEVKTHLNNKYAFKTFKMIRHPIKLFLEWNISKRGERYNDNSRIGDILFEHIGKKIPSFALFNPDKWFNSSPQEKCADIVINYFNEIKEDKNNGVKFLIFEHVVNDTELILNEICKELKLKKKNNFKEKLKLYSLPRNPDLVYSMKKSGMVYSKPMDISEFENYKNIISTNQYNTLLDMGNKYEKEYLKM